MSREVHVRFCESRGVRFPPATHLVVLVSGTTRTLRPCAKTSPRCSPRSGCGCRSQKTQVVHMSEGFDFLGFRIQRQRKRGTNKWYVYTFIADRPIRSVKDKIRALTPRTSQQDLRAVLIRINQIMRGWTNYFRHAVAQRTFSTFSTSPGGGSCG